MASRSSARRQTVHRTVGVAPLGVETLTRPTPKASLKVRTNAASSAQMDAGHGPATQRERPLAGEEPAEES
jgi:hypothetical protein